MRGLRDVLLFLEVTIHSRGGVRGRTEVSDGVCGSLRMSALGSSRCVFGFLGLRRILFSDFATARCPGHSWLQSWPPGCALCSAVSQAPPAEPRGENTVRV